MAFASDNESSGKGAETAAQAQNGVMTATNAATSSSSLPGASASSSHHQSSQEHDSQTSDSSVRDLPLSQQSDSDLAMPDEWAGGQAQMFLREEGVNLSDYSFSDSDSRDGAPFRSPSGPGLSRQNSQTGSGLPPLVRQRSIERAVTSRNMMNNYQQTVQQGQQQPQLQHAAPSEATAAQGYETDDLFASPRHGSSQPTLAAVEGSPTNVYNHNHLEGYAGMTMPPIATPSTSAASFQVVTHASSSSSVFAQVAPAQIKSEPFDGFATRGVAMGFDAKVYLPTDSVDKSSSYEWGEEFNRLYAVWKTSVPLNIFVPDPTAHYVLRARLLFADDRTPVERCADCSQCDTDPNASHVVRFDGNDATYVTDGSDRYVQCILTPLEGGSTATRVLVKFWCRNSCDKRSSNARGRLLCLELLTTAASERVGSKEISVRVCASPGRDYQNDVEKLSKKPEVRKREACEEKGGTSSDESAAKKKRKVKSNVLPGTEKKNPADYLKSLLAEQVDIYAPKDAMPEELESWKEIATALHYTKFAQECMPWVWEKFVNQVLPVLE